MFTGIIDIPDKKSHENSKQIQKFLQVERKRQLASCGGISCILQAEHFY